MARVAINGLGRIGRAALKILLDHPSFELVAVNDLADAENLAYLLRFDTVYGRYHRTVETSQGQLRIDGRPVHFFQQKDPSQLAALTQVVDGNLVKIMSWYDNEWGYSSQMIRHALSLIQDAG